MQNNQPAPLSAEDQEFLQGLFLANYSVLLRYAQTAGKPALERIWYKRRF